MAQSARALVISGSVQPHPAKSALPVECIQSGRWGGNVTSNRGERRGCRSGIYAKYWDVPGLNDVSAALATLPASAPFRDSRMVNLE
jgi:hypothetical protein